MEQEAPVVLVVDDDRDRADMYASWLRTEFPVRTAYTGRQALESLDEDVSVVLLDRRMPAPDGDEILEVIRERDLSCRVAMVTAVEADVDVHEMGVDDSLVEPVDGDDLRETVHRLHDLDRYESAVQEYFALVSRLTALEESSRADDLEESEEYRRLVARVEHVRPSARRQLEGLFDREEDKWIYERTLASGEPPVERLVERA